MAKRRTRRAQKKRARGKRLTGLASGSRSKPNTLGTRRIGGRTFRVASAHNTKARALNTAERIRSGGGKARVIQTRSFGSQRDYRVFVPVGQRTRAKARRRVR